MKTFHGTFQHESICSKGLSPSFSPVSHRPGLAAAGAVCQAPDATELPSPYHSGRVWLVNFQNLPALCSCQNQAPGSEHHQLVRNSAFLFHVTGLLPGRRRQESMGILGGKPGSGGFLKVSPPGEEHRDRVESVPEVCRPSKHCQRHGFFFFLFYLLLPDY